MIEQQLYAKTEKGLIKNAPGLDTVAKSAGLENSYITNYVHQYCRYIAPEKGFIDGSKAPKVKIYAPLINSDVLIGQSTFCEQQGDASFISHNYIIKKNTDQWEDYVKNVANLVYASEFITKFDKNDSPTLPQLEALPLQKGNYGFASRGKLFAKNNISVQNFRQLLAAAFYAIEKRKKIFISLKGSLSETEQASLEILKYMFAALPYEMRRKLGYSTFFYDGDVVTGVEVYFVYNGLMPERGNIIQLGRRSCAKDYIFDFEHENFLHLDFADCEKSEYLSYVILNIDHLDRMAGFYDFAHSVAGHLPPSQKTSLRLYDDLMLLYSMEQMEDAELLSYAGRMLTSLGDMLAGGNENQHFVSIYHKFLKKYAAAILATQAQISNDIFKRLVNQYDNALDEGKELIRTVMSANIENCSQLDANEQLFDYMSIAGGNQPLYKQLIEEKLLQRPEIFDTYLKHMFSQKRTVHSLFEYVDGLITSIPSLLDNEGFKAMLHEKSIDLYAASGDRYIALKYLEDKCKFYQEKYPALAAVFSEIYVTCLTQFMKSLSISSFSTDHILDFSLEEVACLDVEAQTKYNTILALKEILMLTTDQTMAFIHYDAFGFDGLAEKLSPDPEQAKKAEKEIKMKLWSAMGEKKSASKRCVYPVLLYASETNENGSMNYDFERIFRYIETSLESDALDFITWFMTGNLYIIPVDGQRLVIDRETTDTRILERFYKAVLNYYRRSNGANLRDSRYLKKLTQSLNSSKNKHGDFKAVLDAFNSKFDEVVRQNSSPLSKLANLLQSSNKKIVALVVVVAVVITAAVLAGRHFAGRTEPVGGNPAASQSPAPGQSASPAPKKVVSPVNKSGWAATRLTKAGESTICTNLLSEDLTQAERFSFETDDQMEVTFNQPISINGVLIKFQQKPENLNELLEIYVLDETDKKIVLSEGETADGQTIYAMDPAVVKKVILKNKNATSQGVLDITEINGFIYR